MCQYRIRFPSVKLDSPGVKKYNCLKSYGFSGIGTGSVLHIALTYKDEFIVRPDGIRTAKAFHPDGIITTEAFHWAGWAGRLPQLNKC